MSKLQRLVLWIAILASFVAFLDGSVVNVGLPAIVNELGGGLATQQWVVDAYLITLGSLMLIAGAFSDIFGRKKILIAGLIGFGVASLLCAIAPNALFLIIARGLQGIAGALLVPSSLALIMSAFDGRSQGKAVGSWTAWTGIAMIVGPLLGGFLVDAGSWRLIFAINVLPIAITLWLLKFMHLPEVIRKRTKVDIVGALLCAVGLGGPVYALIEQSHYGWSSPLIYLPLAIGLIAAGAFVWYERRSSHPMLPLDLFSVGNFTVGNLATTAIYGALSVAIFLITVFLQQIAHFSAVEAGLSLLPVTLLMFFLSSRFGAWSSKIGPRLFMACGPIIAAVGFLLLLRISVPVDYLTEVLPGVLVFGLGLSMTVAPLTSAILGSIKTEHAGIGSAVNNAVARVAGLIAVAAIGLVAGATLNQTGFHNGLIAMAILLIIGGLISAIGIRNPKLAD